MLAAFDVTALTKAFEEAESFIVALIEKETGMKPEGPPMEWIPINENQAQLVRRFEAVGRDLKYLPELKAWARDTAEELNEILAQHGFTIRLEPWQKSPDKFGVVAIYDITIEWIQEGEIVNKATGQDYKLSNGKKPAFRLDGDDAMVEFYKVKGRVVVKIPGKARGDYLCITRADQLLKQFELLEEAEGLRAQMSYETLVDLYGGVVMPNILFDVKPDISWLVGLHSKDAAGSPWTVTQALMQAKFAMGRKGARAKVAVEVGFKRCSMPMPKPKKPDYIVDHDVLLWMEREDVPSEPFFVAYATRGDFADHQVGLNEID